MSEFEFTFSLWGLLLGLALAEGLGGLARALKARPRIRIGWLTALLGLFVSCDVVTFWMYGWAMRDLIPFGWPTVFGGFVVTAILYVAASLIFPDAPEDWANMDEHFFNQRRKVIGGLMLCNVVLLFTAAGLGAMRDPFSLRTIAVTWAFFPISATAMLSNRRPIIIGALSLLILLYPVSVIWGAG